MRLLQGDLNMNILVCSAGKHVELIKCMKKSLSLDSKVITTANKRYIPALYAADRGYIVSDVHADNYVDEILKICDIEHINVVTTMLDVETLILARAKKQFEDKGILLLGPDYETARLCFDKYAMYNHLRNKRIETMLTYRTFEEFYTGYLKQEIQLPVFVKPISGRGSVDAEKVDSLEQLRRLTQHDPNLIIQEYIYGEDIDIDVYVDIYSKKPITIFAKKKIESKIGGTSKAVSFFDETLNEYIEKVIATFDFSGPLDLEILKKNGKYYFTEINPRFSAAYVHAYACGVDFIKLILNNYNGKENKRQIGEYKTGNVMIKYDTLLNLNQDQVKAGENKV